MEEFTRVLTANDPNVPNNITKYNYKEKCYKKDPEGPMDHLAFHFQLDGCSLHKDSDDLVQQQEFEDNKKMEMERLRKEAALEAFEVIRNQFLDELHSCCSEALLEHELTSILHLLLHHLSY